MIASKHLAQAKALPREGASGLGEHIGKTCAFAIQHTNIVNLTFNA